MEQGDANLGECMSVAKIARLTSPTVTYFCASVQMVFHICIYRHGLGMGLKKQNEINVFFLLFCYLL